MCAKIKWFHQMFVFTSRSFRPSKSISSISVSLVSLESASYSSLASSSLSLLCRLSTSLLPFDSFKAEATLRCFKPDSVDILTFSKSAFLNTLIPRQKRKQFFYDKRIFVICVSKKCNQCINA